MKSFLRFCFDVSLGLWLGATVFFLLALMRLFDRMPGEAGGVASHLFPVYYTIGALCALVALASGILLAAVARRGSWARRLAPVVLAAAMAGVNYYAGWVVLPQAAAARVQVETQRGPSPGGAEAAKARERFQSLHQLSIRLFAAVLVLLVLTLLYSSFALRL